ncbi:MAG: TrkA family potassium uptake protein [Coriobacteriales bacterium]|nr:TrkA family potassium uptake protein [Coriobacteriales bacterium]
MMHVVIGGYGRVGRFLARQLEGMGHSIAVIDRNPEVFEEMQEIRGRRLAGEVFDRGTLVKAGIEKADAFAAVTSGDNSNIIAARIARERFGVPVVVARIFDPQRAEIYEQFGIPSISSVRWAGSRLLTMLLDPHSRSEVAFGTGEVVMVEVDADESMAGRALTELQKPGRLSIAVVERAGVAGLPIPGDVLEAGDRLHVIVQRDEISNVNALLGKGVE